MTAPARSALRARLTGLVATLALIGVVGGLPLVLVAVGGIPDRVPSLDELMATLGRPDDGTLAVTAFVLLGWAAWAVLAGSILAELVAGLHGRTARRIPGLAVPQGAARALVATAALLFLSAPVTSTAATAAPLSTDRPTTASLSVTTQPDRTDRPTAPSRTHVVRPGDSLWSIAGEHLGSGRRYSEIAALNRDRLGGRPDFLEPGTVLRLPATTPETKQATPGHRDATGRRHVVQRGDTLSAIAAERLGDPDRYPEIFRASRDTAQPGGARLRDPDIIDIGWTLTIPDTHGDQGDNTRDSTDDDKLARASAPDTTGNDTTDHDTTDHDTRQRDARSGNDSADPSPTRGRVATPSVGAQNGHERADVGGKGKEPGLSGAQPPRPTPDAAVERPRPSQSTDRPAEQTPDADPATNDDTVTPAWLLTGLAGGGGILAGSMFLALRSRRRAQFRARRPGRTIAVPGPELAPVEKTVTVTGQPGAVRVEWLDEVLRRLASAQSAAGEPMPQLAAIEVTPTDLTLHLSRDQDAPAPWRMEGERRQWRLPLTVDPDSVGPQVLDQPAPYPLLVTIGSTDSGETWLLNCELLTPVNIAGDATYAQDLARYLAAELACNPWSYGVTVHCIGVAEELVDLNPERIHAEPSAHTVTGDALENAKRTLQRATAESADVASARAAQVGAEHWHATTILADGAQTDSGEIEQLVTLLLENPGMTATAVVLTSGDEPARGVQLHVTAQGRVTIPHAGLDLVAVGLTPDEARGCAALLAQADSGRDADITAAQDAPGWRALANEAGALRTEHTTTRDALKEVALVEDRHTSILDLRDEEYVEVAATTADDLQVLAPAVRPETRDLAEQTDPDLDGDLDAWFSESCELPRLTLLGPVRARTRGIAVTRRKPFYTEMLAYLATRPYGATPEELADAFSLSPARTRNDVKIVRDWLGANPRTGRKHLPDAREAPAAKDRGVGVYQVEDVLTDIDLFRRLRVRGEARGADGMSDLRRALTLVEGRPFDRLRPAGWSWLLEGDRLDHHMLCAVVDVAHLVTTHSLAAGDHRTARAATELACLAAPYEEIPRLDLAAVAAAEGHHDEAKRIATHDIAARADEPGPPDELPERTARILEHHAWLGSGQAAS